MKKTYMTPRVEDMGMEANEMICASLSIGGTTTDGSIVEGESRAVEEVLDLDNIFPFE